MMLRYLLLISLLFVFAACSPTAEEATPLPTAETEETHDDEHDADHDEEHDDEHKDEHDEEHEDNHDDKHKDEHEDEHAHEEEDEHREHGAHEHGAAGLLIAWSGNDVAIDLQTPAYNVLGFEYAPSSEAEQTLLDDSIAALETGDLLLLSPDANCVLIEAVVETELSAEDHEEDGEHEEGDEHEEDGEHEEGEEHEEETHSDIAVSYNIQCENPEELDSLDASELFAQFPNFEDLRAQWVSDTQQSAKDLTAADPVLSLK